MRISEWSSDVCSSDLMANAPMSVSNILDQLATTSTRPRYAFAVLALLAEQAGPTGKTGPFITDDDEEKLSLREYIGKHLARMSEIGRASCRERVCQYV